MATHLKRMGILAELGNHPEENGGPFSFSLQLGWTHLKGILELYWDLETQFQICDSERMPRISIVMSLYSRLCIYLEVESEIFFFLTQQ